MFGKTFTLFRMFGFDVRIDVSWLVILVLVVWSLAGGVFPAQYSGMHWSIYLTMGVLAAIGLFASIVLHELCHSLVAQQYGLPMKGITLFIFGGVAEMAEEPPSAKAELLMAVAGPLASLAIAVAFVGAAFMGATLSWPEGIILVLRWIGLINVILVAFNLIPGFPLDGGRVLRAILWHWRGNLRWATRVASQVGAGFGLVLIGLGFLSLLGGNPLGGLWWILIGMFVRAAAKQGYQQVLIRQALHGEPVRRFMSAEPVTVPPDLSVQELVDEFIYRHHFKMFPVVENGALTGCVTTSQVKQVPRHEWSQRMTGEIALPCSEENTIDANSDAMKALATMTRTHASRLVVVDDGKLVGVLALKDLLRFLALKLELETDDSLSLPTSVAGQESG